MRSIARGFTDEKKEAVRKLLIREGKRLFGIFGLKKTSIGQLTEAAGISPAAFYKFFDSKEALYFHIFEQEAERFQNLLLEKLEHSGNLSSTSTFRNMFLTMMSLYKSDPFAEQLFSGSDFKHMLLALSKEEIDGHVLMGYAHFTPLFERLRNEGKLIAEDPKVLITVMQLFFLLNEQRSHFDAGIFDRSMTLLAGWIAEGFTNSKQ